MNFELKIPHFCLLRTVIGNVSECHHSLRRLLLLQISRQLPGVTFRELQAHFPGSKFATVMSGKGAGTGGVAFGTPEEATAAIQVTFFKSTENT